ncbi:MAG: translation elongation factor Ts [Candidatus Tectomicrobia bacterium]|nr:translation elongation factor Ts [Candidatus Tectomicrobia bacterium]
MEITASMVKELREKTGAGIMDCKRALAETEGEFEKAVDYLRQKGLSAAAKKSGRATSEGIVGAYIHAGGKIGVLIEVNCETDFVARTEAFQQLVKDLSMQIAAANPLYLAREDIPQEVLSRERAIYEAQAREMRRPENVIPRIVEGKLEKYFSETCLIEQSFVKDEEMTIAQLLAQHIAKLGENITIRRFVRYHVGVD